MKSLNELTPEQRKLAGVTFLDLCDLCWPSRKWKNTWKPFSRPIVKLNRV